MKTTTFLAGLLAIFLVGLPTRSLAQERVDFVTALELARKNNPDWQAAEREIEIARGGLTTARLVSPFNPVLEGEAGRRRMPGEGSGADYGVGLSMQVEVAGQRGLRISEAEKNLNRAEAGFRDFARSFRARLARAFYQTTAARERLSLLRRVEDLNRRVLEVSRAKFKAGDISGLELNVASVRYSQALKQILDAERELSLSLLELQRLVGVDEPLMPTGALPVTAPPVTAADALAQALANRPDILAKNYELERLQSEIALRRREIFPNPSVGISYNREASGDHIVLGGLSFALPVFNRNQGELQKLQARASQVRAEVLALRQEVQKEVNQALRAWETARQNVDLFQKEILDQMAENFRLLEAAYRERRIDLPQLLVMENDLISANQAYLDALAATRDAAIRLEEVTGEAR